MVDASRGRTFENTHLVHGSLFSLDTSPQPLLFLTCGTIQLVSLLRCLQSSIILYEQHISQKSSTTLVLHFGGGVSCSHKVQWRCVTFLRRFGYPLSTLSTGAFIFSDKDSECKDSSNRLLLGDSAYPPSVGASYNPRISGRSSPSRGSSLTVVSASAKETPSGIITASPSADSPAASAPSTPSSGGGLVNVASSLALLLRRSRKASAIVRSISRTKNPSCIASPGTPPTTSWRLVALVPLLNRPRAFCRAPMSGSFRLNRPHMLFQHPFSYSFY
jgi:hypothetical protein